jgi:hypothetical protein
MAIQEDATKWILAAKSFWGIAVGFATTVLPMMAVFGVNITPADIKEVAESGNVVISNGSAIVMAVGGLVGAALSMWGLIARKLGVRWTP